MLSLKIENALHRFFMVMSTGFLLLLGAFGVACLAAYCCDLVVP